MAHPRLWNPSGAICVDNTLWYSRVLRSKVLLAPAYAHAVPAYAHAVPAYARAVRCPVLTRCMLLRQVEEGDDTTQALSPMLLCVAYYQIQYQHAGIVIPAPSREPLAHARWPHADPAPTAAPLSLTQRRERREIKRNAPLSQYSLYQEQRPLCLISPWLACGFSAECKALRTRRY
eukprot:1586729-Rhodomonas_salina.2